MRIVEPPADMIDWHMFKEDLWRRWDSQQHMQNDAEIKGAGSRSRIWWGEGCGTLLFIRLCKLMGKDPMRYYVER